MEPFLGRRSFLKSLAVPCPAIALPVPGGTGTVVRAMEFESRRVYQSKQHPSYASWATFFPGENGSWYIGCVEQRRVTPPRPASTPAQDFWRNGGPMAPGYDHKQNHVEMLLLKSSDGLRTWNVISRWDADPIGTAAWGAFAQARTCDGRFLRFIWQAYADQLDGSGRLTGNRIYYISSDEGRTWKAQPPFHDVRFFSFAHRLRTLRDGTLVLAIPFSPGYGPGHARRTRMARDLDSDTDMQMTLYISGDQGRSWSGPISLFGGLTVSETDFVELPSGDLLFVNWLPPRPGRQIVYRSAEGWLPGPAERHDSGVVPETIALTRDGILIGCLRPGSYHWSEDLGKNWHRLEGIPDRGPESYQPWIESLADGRIACAGQYGGDDPMGLHDQYISLHLFRPEIRGKAVATRISLTRDFDEASHSWTNRFIFTLAADETPLASRDLEVWYVERDKPGYNSYADLTLSARMKLGGHLVRLRTDTAGRATLALHQFDHLSWGHHTIQIAARFNADHQDASHQAAETALYEFYTRVQSGASESHGSR